MFLNPGKPAADTGTVLQRSWKHRLLLNKEEITLPVMQVYIMVQFNIRLLTGWAV